MKEQVEEDNRRKLLGARQILASGMVFVAAFFSLWGFGRVLRHIARQQGWQFDAAANFPISILQLRIPGIHAPLWTLGIALAVLLAFVLLVRNLGRVTSGVVPVLAAGLLLVLGTNLVQGPTYGLVHPQLGPAGYPQYYHDAMRIDSATRFMAEFEQRQPELTVHSRTHPPGAVLLYYALAKTVRHPAAISAVIAALAVVLCSGFFYGIIVRETDPETARYATLLFLLIPAMQIYCCASIDAVVSGCFLGVVYFFRHPRVPISLIGGIVCLFCASFLTFAASFLGPVLIGVEIITRRSIRKSLVFLLGVTVLYIFLYFATGMNYPAAFRTASALENPAGFMLFSEPANYLYTRLEDVCEILVFFGPFLLMLFIGGIRTMRHSRPRPELLAWTICGIGTLAAMFLSGAFRTGETARACLFIVPYLMFPVAAQLEQCGRREIDRKALLWLVFGQALAMQTFGGYTW